MATRRVVELPPADGIRPDGSCAGGWWHDAEIEARLICDLCPRACNLKPDDRGFCFVRQNVGGEMVLTTYGRSTGFCIDPIEKKPLNHFLPGTSVLSFGTAGCNLGCKFCQNWDISKSRQVERLSETASPGAIAAAARRHACRSVAYTYNDPVIWAEYAIDTARECRAMGIRNVAVTAGYISPAARGPFFEDMDAANVDLKAFTEEFYHKITYSHLQPVLDTLEWLKRETPVWFEITNLVIPQANDALDEIRAMCDWILDHVGDEVPLHFSAFHPDFRMLDRPATPHATLLAARETAQRQGVKFVYTGNVDDVTTQSTYCPNCRGLLIERNWYDLGAYHLRGSCCGHCGQTIAGVFEDGPGDWGRKRLPVRMSPFVNVPPRTSRRTESIAPARAATSPQQETKHMASEPQPRDAEPRNSSRAPQLSSEQERRVLQATCEIVAAAVVQRPERLSDPTLGGAADQTVMGVFVTLKREGRLRSCCGVLGRPLPLNAGLRQAAIRTATDDTRFPTISPTELRYLTIDVSLLHRFQNLTSRGRGRIESVEVGRHGLQIQRGAASGLLLPSVATEHGYDAEEFLRQVCRKAGLPTTAWEDDATLIQTFEAAVIGGPFEEASLGNEPATSPWSADDLRRLATHCTGNLTALAQGATPSYYAPECADGTVNAVTLSLKPAGAAESLHLFRFSLRPGMPLQSTLFSVTEGAAGALRAGKLGAQPGDVQLGLSLLSDPAMHGTVADPDLRGIDPARRAIMVVEGSKSAWAFDPQRSPAELLATTAQAADLFAAETASVFSFAAQSTEPSVLVANAPRPRSGPTIRTAAVAGSFYPASAAELGQMVTGMLSPGNGAADWPAILVPHAGLVYSGRIAAQVFQKVRIPETVIVIGPKHTRLGVEWAVAPHEEWSIPGAKLRGDIELARRLAESIPGLQLDAAAHQQEHAIEVELPFLARLAPAARIVAIAIGGLADFARCREFASGLGQVLRELDRPPLLVISSDMNHYASDTESRRLDEIALAAIERRDPRHAFDTVMEHGISMCGVRPAVIVMEALRQLGGLARIERVAYGTSADVTGDKSRVVGYAGMLLR